MFPKLQQLHDTLQAQAPGDRPRVLTSRLVAQTLGMSREELSKAVKTCLPLALLYGAIGKLLTEPLEQRWPKAAEHLRERNAEIETRT